MIGALIITHGNLGKELAEVTKTIVGKQDSIETISLTPGQSAAELKAKVENALLQFNLEEGVIIFTDMYGGTPMNVALPLILNKKIELLTGINLPMLLEFFASREFMPLTELAQKVKISGQKTIIDAKEIFLQKLKKHAVDS